MKITINYNLADKFLIKQLSENKPSSFLKKQQTLTLDAIYDTKDIELMLDDGAKITDDGSLIWNISGEFKEPIKDKTDLDDYIKSLKFVNTIRNWFIICGLLSICVLFILAYLKSK